MYNKNSKQSTQFIHFPHNSFQDIRSISLKNYLCHWMEKVNQIVVEYCAKNSFTCSVYIIIRKRQWNNKEILFESYYTSLNRVFLLFSYFNFLGIVIAL